MVRGTVYRLGAILVLFVLVGGQVNTWGQVVFSGKVVNSKSGEAMELVNVSIDNSTVGTTTDINGGFLLILPNEYLGSKATFSAVGYESQSLVLRKEKLKDLNIKLEPTNYKISAVNISEKSMWSYGCIKKVISRIADNYFVGAMNMQGVYHSVVETGGKKRSQSARVLLSDTKGYVKQPLEEAYTSVNYTLKEVNIKGGDSQVTDKLTQLDLLVDMDWVRLQHYLLDSQAVHVYDLVPLDDQLIEGEKVWVIHFTPKEVHVANTGDAQVTDFEGEIYIGQTSLAVYKIRIDGKSKCWSWNGRSVLCDPEVPMKAKNIDYHYEVNYSRRGDLLYLSSILLDATYENGAGQRCNEKSELRIEEFTTQHPSMLKKRDYYLDE